MRATPNLTGPPSPWCGSASNWDPLALHAQPLAAAHLSGLLVGPDWTPTEFGDFDAFTNACRALGAERDGSQLDADPHSGRREGARGPGALGPPRGRPRVVRRQP